MSSHSMNQVMEENEEDVMERQLIRDGKARCSIVGLVPEIIVPLLDVDRSSSSNHGVNGTIQNMPSTGWTFGTRVDSNRITIWRQRIATLSEPLLSSNPNKFDGEEEEEEWIKEFYHPDENDDVHVSLWVPPTSTYTSSRYGSNSMYNASSNNNGAVLWIFAASSKGGTLCVWTVPLSGSRSSFNDANGSRNCNAMVRLPLELEERITAITTCSQSSDVYLGTSHSRLWMAIPHACPLELRARRLFRKTNIRSSILSAPSSYLSSFFFTQPEHPMDGDPSMSHEADEISFLFLCNASPSNATSENSASPKPPPLKIAKLNHPSSTMSTASSLAGEQGNKELSLLAITKYGLVQIWNLTNSNANNNNKEEQYISTLNLHSAFNGNNHNAEDNPLLVSNAVVSPQCLVAAVQNLSEGKLYMLYCPIHKNNNGQLQVSISTKVCLTRYSTDSISNGLLSCAGLTINTTKSSSLLEATVYSLWQINDKKSSSPHPVTLTCVQFRDNVDDIVNNNPTPAQALTYDVDLPKQILPLILLGAVSQDIITDGCLFIATSGCVANALVQLSPHPHTPGMSKDAIMLSSTTTPLQSETDAQTVRLLTNHLLSAFKIHLRSNSSPMSSPSPNHTTVSSSSLPQSIISCTSTHLLSQAVIEAAKQLSTEQDNDQAQSTNCIECLKHLLDTHTQFVNFCIHAAIYKKCNTSCKMALRSIGEVIYGMGSMYSYWQMILEQQQDIDNDNSEQFNAILEIRKFISKMFLNLHHHIIDFAPFLQQLQKGVFEYLYQNCNDPCPWKENLFCDNINRESVQWVMNKLSCLLSFTMEYAMEYRTDKSEKLYDLQSSPPNPNFGWGDSVGSFPWTSDPFLLELLLSQLQYVLDEPNILDNFSGESNDTVHSVEIIAPALLNGYLDVPSNERDDQQYHIAKEIAINVVQHMCGKETYNNDHDTENSSLAFKLSLQHAYFDGVVSIAHPHTFANQYNKKTTTTLNKRNNDKLIANLFSILLYIQSEINKSNKIDSASNDKGEVIPVEKDNPYVNLHMLTDIETGFRFPKYVLWWYTNRGLYGNVLQLGECCPEILHDFMSSDARLRDFIWIQQIRDCSYSTATSSLTKLVSLGLSAFGEKSKTNLNKNCSLTDRKLVLSLAKISAKISEEKEQHLEKDKTLIHDNLELVQAQTIAMDLLGSKQVDNGTINIDNYAMNPEELLTLSLKNIQELNKMEDRVRLALVGISVAKVSSEKSINAGRIWGKVIENDMNTWKILMDLESEMSDKERAIRVSETLLYNLAKEYYFDSAKRAPVDNVVCFQNNPVVIQNAVKSAEETLPGIRVLLKKVVNMPASEMVQL